MVALAPAADIDKDTRSVFRFGFSRRAVVIWRHIVCVIIDVLMVLQRRIAVSYDSRTTGATHRMLAARRAVRTNQGRNLAVNDRHVLGTGRCGDGSDAHLLGKPA